MENTELLELISFFNKVNIKEQDITSEVQKASGELIVKAFYEYEGKVFETKPLYYKDIDKQEGIKTKDRPKVNQYFKSPVYWLDIQKHDWPKGTGESDLDNLVIKEICEEGDVEFEKFLKLLANNSKSGKIQRITSTGRSQQYGHNLENNNHWHDLVLLIKAVIDGKGQFPDKRYFKRLVFNWSTNGEKGRISLSKEFGKRLIIDSLCSSIARLSQEQKHYVGDQVLKSNAPLNQILYGPPGTGKTYYTINKAIQIINPEFDLAQERTVIKVEFESLIKAGQIVFTTFHQSMSYEDFIEGIKPQKPNTPKDPISYDIEPGIFKRIAEAAKSNFESTKSQNQQKLTFEEALTHLMDEWDMNPGMLFPLRTPGYEFTILSFSNTSIPFKNKNGGTSHSLSINTLKGLYYGTREFDFKQGVGIYYPSVLEKLHSYQNDKADKNALLNFVLIIDEINRGNVSQIFGELITLIESDKRLGNKEALEVTLPYSKEPFSVPPNLYILGTMNTADRSVEALDTALRRRFSFEEMPPNPKLISPGGLIWKLLWDYPKEPWDHLEYKAKEETLFSFLGASKDLEKKLNEIWDKMEAGGKLEEQIAYFDEYDFAGIINLQALLETINQRLEILLDKDHLIGHAYFMHVDSIAALQATFYQNIIPLLQEYFYGDYGKIGLVLGSKFVQEKKRAQFAFAPFDYPEQEIYSERSVYEIKDYRHSEPDFISALELLMNKK